MRKNFTLCTTLLLLSLLPGWTTASATDGDVLRTVAQAAGKSFTIRTNRGYWYANLSGNNLAGSKGDLNSVDNRLDFKDLTDISRFTIVKNTNFNRYYLYNIDNSKWVSVNGSYLSLVDKPVYSDSIGFVNSTGSTEYPTCIYFRGNLQYMFGISYAYTPDVYKYQDLNDDGNRSLIRVSGTVTDYSNLVSIVDGLFRAEKVVSASPIADPSDFNGQAGKAYLIHNVSSSRNGYLHVDASGNITWKATLPNRAEAEYNNFVFTTEAYGSDLVLKAYNGEYLPMLLSSLTDGTNITTTSEQISGAGVVTVAAKSGYKPTTLNFLIDSRYMNVNNNGGVTPWNNVNDANGVWEFTPVSNDDNDFITADIKRHITSVNGVTTTTGGNVTYSTERSLTFRSGQHIYVAPLNFLSDGVGVAGQTTTVDVSERLPFEISTDGKWYWYNVSLRDNKWLCANTDGTVSASTTFTDNDNSLWAFTGNTATGITIHNKGKGTSYSLKDYDSSNPKLEEINSSNKFIIYKREDGFTLGTTWNNSANLNNRLNDVNGTLGHWNNSGAPNDNGSTFRVFLPKGFYTMKNYRNVAMGDTGYGYLGLSTEADKNNQLKGSDANVSLNDVVYIAPYKAPSVNTDTKDPRYVTMQLQGQSIQGISQSTQVTVGSSTVSFKVARPNAGFFAFGSAVSNDTPDARSYLHTDGSKNIVGWETAGEATSWQVSPASAITMPANAVNGTYYATFYAPFAVKLTGAKAYTLTLNKAKTSATLNPVTLTDNVLPAKSAVLIIADAATYTVEPVISETPAISSILTGVSLAESWSNHENDLVLGKLNGVAGFYKWSTTNTLKNNRCYLPASLLGTSAAKGVTFYLGATTGINAANLQPAKDEGKIYNLQGQEVGHSYKGIVIKDGHKVIQ